MKEADKYSLEFSKAAQYEDCPLVHLGDKVVFADEEYVVTGTSIDTMGSSSYLICHVINEDGNTKKLRLSDCGYYWTLKDSEGLCQSTPMTI